MTEWHLHDKEIDVLFDQWFANEPQDKIEELKQRGVTKGDLARFQPRIDLIAVDIWAHYRAFVMVSSTGPSANAPPCATSSGATSTQS